MVQVADRLLLDVSPALAPRVDEQGARRALRRQIARLERQLADALVTGFPVAAIDVAVTGRDGPRLLDLGELEALRDDLAAQLQRARAALTALADRQHQARALLEAMYADPRRHRFVRIARAELGVGGCGAYEVRPRLGLVGMLAGWWHVKLSSGCPLAVRGEPASYSVPMGRRSRKRSAAPSSRVSEPAPVPAPARPAPAALTRRARSEDRPPAPWGTFPLGELCTLAGIVVVIVGFTSQSGQMLAVGFSLIALSATELAAREHLAGFRSHSALLGLIIGAVTAVVLVVAGAPRVVQIGAAVAAFLAGAWVMRRAFQARAGGMGFRA
ncbi:MAG: hypothetical protein JWM73_169 [Solirubrobacterales bacterium]|nr:hypothetical protein [Solirubrobacterales bacterium]